MEPYVVNVPNLYQHCAVYTFSIEENEGTKKGKEEVLKKALGKEWFNYSIKKANSKKEIKSQFQVPSKSVIF